MTEFECRQFTNKDATPVMQDSAFAATTEMEERYDYQLAPFKEIRQYPNIKDTVVFIKALVENCHIFYKYRRGTAINYFRKIKLYGSDKYYYLIEYDYIDGSTAAFPWKMQLLFNSSGKLLKKISAMKLESVKLFPGHNPFLLGVCATGKGNGWHEIYRINSDTVTQIMDGFNDYYPKTYDAHADNTINIPSEFPYTLEDVNQDGHNDLIFRGKIEYYHISEQVDLKQIKAKFVFLYHPQTGHFTELENYSEKFRFVHENNP